MPRGMGPGFQVLSYYIRQKPFCQALFAVFPVFFHFPLFCGILGEFCPSLTVDCPYSNVYGLFFPSKRDMIFLRQYRINRQESLTRDFSSEKGVKPQEYSVYFKVLQTNFWRKRVPGVPTKAQQSGFGGERRHSEATELLPSKGQNEGYEACADAIRRRICAVLP